MRKVVRVLEYCKWYFFRVKIGFMCLILLIIFQTRPILRALCIFQVRKTEVLGTVGAVNFM